MLPMEVVITRSWLIIMAVHLLPRFRLTRLTLVRSFGKNTLTTASKKAEVDGKGWFGAPFVKVSMDGPLYEKRQSPSKL